jgi:hypothetical protein
VQTDATRTLTVSGLFDQRQNATVPIIRLSGRWLIEAGFAVGQSIQVAVARDSITIIPMTFQGRNCALRCLELPNYAHPQRPFQLELPLG